MNIIEFIEHPDFLNDQRLSPAQKMVLKAVYGLPLTSPELILFKQTTSLARYREGVEQEEATFILGRRAGKSDTIASNIALYEACSRKHKLSVGQLGVVMVVASEMERQTKKVVFKLIRDKLLASPILKKMVENITKSCITLNNGIEIQIYPPSIGKVRGISLVAFIGDECAYWKVEGKDVDVDVLDSVRPGLDLEFGKLIKISTPYMMRGEIYHDFKEYHGKQNDDVLVFRGGTKLIRPDYSDRKLARMKKRNPVAYMTEYEAHFRTDLSAMYDPFVIDKAIEKSRPLELPYQSGRKYKAFVDVAGGGGKDSYAVAIGHLEDKRVVVDVVRSRAPKFNPDALTEEYSELFKSYSISKVTGDKFSGDWASTAFEKNGITYEKSERTKSELYLEAEGPFNTERVELPDREVAVTQLKNLIRKVRSGGKDSVDTDGGYPEDEANVIAGVVCSMSAKPLRPAVRVWRADDPYDKPWLTPSERKEREEHKAQAAKDAG